MRDHADRATWQALVAFGACMVVILGGAYLIRSGLFRGGPIETQAAFGGGQVDNAITLYMSQGRICETYFTEPFETCIIVMHDLTALTFSTHESGRISATASLIVERIKAAGYEAKDIIAIVHNHFTPAGFTSADRATHAYLKSLGFTGVFGIWYTATKKFLAIEERR